MKRKSRVYLSGPITGVENYKLDFEVVESELILLGFDKIINPANLDVVIREGDYEEYMKACLTLVDMSDIVIMLPGWEKSSGANREMGYALGADKIVIEWNKRGDEWNILADS